MHSLPAICISGGLELVTDGFPEIYERVGALPGFLSRYAAYPSSLLPSQSSGPVPLLSVLPHNTPYHHALALLVVGALSVKALTRSGRPLLSRSVDFSNILYPISPRLDLGLLHQPKNSRPGFSTGALHTICSHVSSKLWTSFSRVSPRTGPSGPDPPVATARSSASLRRESYAISMEY